MKTTERPPTIDRFAAASAVADTVLYEGYVLYPYRASAAKNQLRFQFGVLTPTAVSEADASERSSMRTECLVEPGASPRLWVRIRFLHIQHRVGGDGAPWDEAIDRQVDLDDIALLPLSGTACDVPFHFDAGEDVRDGVIRRRERVDGVARVRADWADGPGALVKVSVTIENTSHWAEPVAARTEAMRWSLVAVHTLLAVHDGVFVSLLDPPDHAGEAAKGCVSEGTYPVLVGDGESDVVLSSPIILYDHPAIASESEGDLFDATEIDEILALRVLTLTDEEKAEARRTDARAAAIVDRIDDFSPDVWARLHGTMRSVESTEAAEPLPWWDPSIDDAYDPFSDTLVISGRTVTAGTSVRLHPNRRSDAQDMFLTGMNATVTGVFTDVDEAVLVAVTVDDDPATEALAWQGRALFFHPDELEVIS